MKFRDRILVSIGALPSRRNGGKVLGNLFPVIDADEASCSEVMRSGIENALALEAEEILGQVVDEIVGAKDGLVAAEDVVRGRDERKVSLQPGYLEPSELGTAMAWVAM